MFNPFKILFEQSFSVNELYHRFEFCLHMNFCFLSLLFSTFCSAYRMPYPNLDAHKT